MGRTRRGQGLAAVLLGLTLVTMSTGCTVAPGPAAATRTDALTPSQAAAGCRSYVAGDVNGDGYADVAIGAPGENQQRGAVHLFYGYRGRLVSVPTGSAPDDVEITQDSSNVPDAGEPGDRFGSTTLLTDLNGDRCADLVVGSRGEDHIGSITVLYGSPRGLQTTGSVAFGVVAQFGPEAATHQPDNFGYLDPDAYRAFGDELATGDFDSDGITDLVAAWAPANVDDSVAVLYGSRAGLSAGRPTTRLGTGQLGVTDRIQSMAAGDFDGDRQVELALGVDDGVAIVSARAGVFTPGTRISSKTPGMPKAPRNNAYHDLGGPVVAGDITGDGRDDLVLADSSAGIGEPESEYGKGLIVFLPGSARGLTAVGSQLWTQDSPGVEGPADYGNWFGQRLAIGSLDGDRYADLVVSGQVSDSPDDGLTVLRGGPKGLSTAGYGGTPYTQSTRGIVGTAEAGDSFGQATVISRLAGPGVAGALVIGAPGEDGDAVTDAGSITQLGASSSGPQPTRSQTLTLDSPGVGGTSSRGAEFGSSLG